MKSVDDPIRTRVHGEIVFQATALPSVKQKKI